ncbi:MAG: hypothetical protein WC947_09415 [Elusimicrobiota bacterium]
MLKINWTILTELMLCKIIRNAPWPFNKLIENWKWNRDEKWFQKEIQDSPQFRRLIMAGNAGYLKVIIDEEKKAGNLDKVRELEEELNLIEKEIAMLDEVIGKVNSKFDRREVNRNPALRKEYEMTLKTSIKKAYEMAEK